MIVFEKNHQTHAEGDRKDNPLKASSQRSLRGRHSSPRATSWLYIVSINGSSLAKLPLLPQGDRKGPIPTQHHSRPYKDYDQSGNYLLYVHDYYLLFLVFFKYVPDLSHFATDFSIAQLTSVCDGFSL